jgi:hypothetical protein
VGIGVEALAWAKVGIALLAAAVVGVEVLNGRAWAHTCRVLFACAVLATGAYFEPALARGELVHRWEMFHYYLGAKYQPELGYERLYACVTETDIADGIRNARERPVRDLRTEELVTGARAVERAGACENALGSARFAAFHADVRAFRRLVGNRRAWEQMFEDHGYNPPPLWTAVGRALAGSVAPTRASLTLLACLDLGLMAIAVGALVWGFGARIAALGVIFWGTQAPAEFSWVGGGLLRMDWLCCAILGLVLLRRGRPAWAGAALVTAALLRLFPAVLLVGVGATMASALVRRRSLRTEHWRFVLGSVLAATALVSLSTFALGAGAYLEFWRHIQLRTGVISNHMGLRTLFSYTPSVTIAKLADHTLLDPSVPWALARSARLASLDVAYRAAAAAIALLVLFAAWRLRTLWLAVALSLALIPALTEPSCYYYSVWVLALPLARVRPAVGVTLLGVAAGGQLVGLRYAAYDERYFALAVLYVGSALVLLVSFTETPAARLHAFRRRRERARRERARRASAEKTARLGELELGRIG